MSTIQRNSFFVLCLFLFIFSCQVSASPTLLTVTSSELTIGFDNAMLFSADWVHNSSTVRLLIANNANFTDCNYAVTSGCLCYSAGETENQSNCTYLIPPLTTNISWYAQICDENAVCDNSDTSLGEEDTIFWNKRFDSNSGGSDSATDVAVDSEGNVYIVGTGENLLNDASGTDWWLKKYTSNGTEDIVNWNKSFDGSLGDDIPFSVTVDDTNVYVVGSAEELVSDSSGSDWWLKKFSTSGVEDTANWNKSIDSSGDGEIAYSVDIDSSGNVYVVGYGLDLISDSSGNDWWVKKFSSDGVEDISNWNKSFDGAGGSDTASSVVIDNDYVYVVGFAYNLYNGSSYDDWWLKKFSSDGVEDTVNWNKSFNSFAGSDVAYGVDVDSSGNVFVVGNGVNLISGSSGTDWWLKKFSSDGVEDASGWNKTFDGSGGSDSAAAVVVDVDGSVYISGNAENIVTGTSSTDWWLKKFSSDGVEDASSWNKTFDGSGFLDQLFSSTVDENSSVYVVGCELSTVSFSLDWRIKKYTHSLFSGNLTDTLPPLSEIISPQNGSEVSGTIKISVSAEDVFGIANVSFFNSTHYLGYDTTPDSNGYYSYLLCTVGSCADNNLTIRAVAYDYAGNSNSSEINVTVNVTSTVGAYLNTTINVDANVSTNISVNTSTHTNITLELQLASSVTNASIAISEFNDTTVSDLSIQSLNTYIEIETSSEIESALDWTIIRVYYTDDELSNAGVDEDTLRLYYYNETSSEWEPYDPPNGGVVTSENYVWGNSSHFSFYGVGGKLINDQSCSSDVQCSSGNCLYSICKPSGYECYDDSHCTGSCSDNVCTSTPAGSSGGGSYGAGLTIEEKQEEKKEEKKKEKQEEKEDPEPKQKHKEEPNPKIPKHLFDIKLELEETRIRNASELVAWIYFENFGTEPTPINITLFVLDESGNKLDSTSGHLTVITEEVVAGKFEDLVLEPGKYTLVLETLYNVDVKDEFKQDFEVIDAKDFAPLAMLWWILLLYPLYVAFVWQAVKIKRIKSTRSVIGVIITGLLLVITLVLMVINMIYGLPSWVFYLLCSLISLYLIASFLTEEIFIHEKETRVVEHNRGVIK